MKFLSMAAGMATLLALPLLGGCASPHADQVAGAPSRMVGLSETALLSCAGVPLRQGTGPDGTRYFSYIMDNAADDGSRVGIGLGGGGGRVGGGIGFSLPLTSNDEPTCEARFALKDGIVTSLQFLPQRYDTDACYAIVENCLGALPAGQ